MFSKNFRTRGVVAIQAKNITRTHRERLVKNRFIKEVMKGWYVPAVNQGVDFII